MEFFAKHVPALAEGIRRRLWLSVASPPSRQGVKLRLGQPFVPELVSEGAASVVLLAEPRSVFPEAR